MSIKAAYCARFVITGLVWLCRFIKNAGFLRNYGAALRNYYLVLSSDRKRIRFLSAFLVGSTWPMSFPVALLVSLF
jgi:hypothetical protein